MPMSNNGLTKLVEECGELVQIAAKRIAYPHIEDHPDGKGSIFIRLEDEIADVLAAIDFVVVMNELDFAAITMRREQKQKRFLEWHQENPNG